MNERQKFAKGLHRLFIAVLLTVVLGAAPAPAAAAPAVDDPDDLPAETSYAISDAVGADQASYHVERMRAGYALANPAQGFRTTLTRAGVTLQMAGLAWEMNLRAWGYGETLAAVSAVEPTGGANRVTYEREGLTEWYVNGPFGLQQGFTVRQPPGESRGGALTLQLDLPAGLAAQVNESGQNLTLSGADGARRLAYGGLLAWDAAGRALPAWFDLTRDELRILVDDTHAAYPLTVDPWVQTAKLDPKDGDDGDSFGYSVAVSGDTMVVGAPYDEAPNGSGAGSAYVFEKDTGWGNGHVNQVAKLDPKDGDDGDVFGYSVAVSGDTVVVGAFSDENPNGSGAGSAYVFEKGSGWADGHANQVAKLDPSDGDTYDLFGSSVAVSGDTVVVGVAQDEAPNGSGAGSAYVFEKGSGWADGDANQVAKLDPEDADSGDFFGYSVAVSGDTVVVGANYDEDPNGSRAGSAYVFEKDTGWGNGHANQVAKLDPDDADDDDEFGHSVAVSGDTVVVGANYDENHNDSSAGSAYVWECLNYIYLPLVLRNF